jgi:TetR/AcrR family transcriptional regulator, lmrAB and yxaGH operons repressor
VATSSAERMVRGAAALLAATGLQGASFREVVRATGAPRGSIYHHFPGGKAELVTRAVRLVERSVVDVLDGLRGRPAGEVVDGLTAMWRAALLRSDFGSGCAVAALTATAAGELPDLAALAGEVFEHWEAALTGVLVEGGLEADDAAALATTVLAGVEGALLLARARRSIEPFDRVAAQLALLARR